MDPTTLPAEIQALPRFVARDGKFPINPRTGRAASHSDPTTWGTLDAALAAVRRYHLTGISVALGDGLIGIDIDHCWDGTVFTDFALRLVEQLATYTEQSPNDGLHFLCRGTLPGLRCRTSQFPVEIYTRWRFLTLTGQRLTPWGCEERTDALASLYHQMFPAPPEPSPCVLAPISPLTDADVLYQAGRMSGAKFYALWQGDTSGYADNHSYADMGLCCILAKLTRDPVQIDRLLRQSGLMRPKWDSPRPGGSYGGGTITQALTWVRG